MSTLQNSLLEQPVNHSWAREVLIVLMASLIISLSGPIAISLPFTLVPIGLQAHVILFLSLFLGGKRAALAVFAFLMEAAMGLPVCALGKGGIPVLIGPTGGYLFGYLAAAFATGFLMEKVFKRTATHAVYAMGIGNLIIYLFGLPWLAQYCGWHLVWKLGLFPFLIGDFLKLVVAGKLVKMRA
jgi:biotin transport system substrate-specific component